MIIKVNDEEFYFSSWEELGLALKELCAQGLPVTIESNGSTCETCKGSGMITAFHLGDSRPVYMECGECGTTGMKD